jgi:hypothetical protein
MRDQDLKAFSEEVKKGFVEALGDKSYFKSKKVMSHLSNTEFLEYYYEEGLSKGMTEAQAEEYAEDMFENYYLNAQHHTH